MVFCGLDPSPQLLGRFLLGPPYPLLGFTHYCSPNLRKLKGKNKGPRQCLPLNTICFIALKPAREKLPPSCYSLCSPVKPHSAPPQAFQ